MDSGIARDFGKDRLTALVRECGDLGRGRHIHAAISRCGLGQDVFLANLLIQMYGRCGSVDEASGIFRRMPRKNAFSWTMMLGAFTGNGLHKAAVDFFFLHGAGAAELDAFAYSALLGAIAKIGDLDRGKQLHARILDRGFDSDLVVQNALISMYAKCHSLDDSWQAFQKMEIKDVVSWNSIICAYVHHGHAREALVVYYQMLLEGGEPDAVTLATTLTACSNTGDLDQGKALAARIFSMGFNSNVTLQNALVNLYAKCDDLENARKVFQEMEARDSGSWNALMGAYTQHGHKVMALTLFQRMDLEGIEPDAFSFICVFGACANFEMLDLARSNHKRFLAMGFKHDVVTGTAVLNMFGKCQSLSDAKAVFDGMEAKNRVTWNAMMAAYVHAGDNQGAIDLFRLMDLEPDVFSFSTILSACSNLRSLATGRAIYQRLLASGELMCDLVLQNALLNMFSKCGSFVDVRNVFDSMERRDIVSWNAVIGAHVLHERCAEALDLFKSMEVKPDAITFASALTACASLQVLEEGREIHRRAVDAGLDSVTMVRNALVTMYARCGSLEEAEQIFWNTVDRDVVSWSALIAAYAQHGKNLEAVKLFRRMNLDGFEADVYTFASVLSAIGCPDLLQGRHFHRQIISRGLERDTVVGTALINMYARCGDVVTARENFDHLCSRNVVSWNAMIAGYVQAGFNEDALQLYEKMKLDEAKPDELTFASVLAACSNLGEISKGKEVHGDIAANGSSGDLIIQNALVDMYGKCGNLEEGRIIFEGIKNKSIVSWTSMITAYARHGRGLEAVELVWMMSLEGLEADDVTLTSILQACNHSGLVEVAGSVFVTMVWDQEIELTLEHKMCFMDLLGRAGWIHGAEDLLANSRDLKGSAASWTSLLSACERHSEHGSGTKAAKVFWDLQRPGGSVSFIILSNMLQTGLSSLKA